MTNLIRRDIRNLFPSELAIPPAEELIEKLQIDQYLGKTEEIYYLNLVSTKIALNDVDYILKLEDPNLNAIAWTALGGIHTFNGDYRKAFCAFSRALDQTVVTEVNAYILTELSNLWRKLGYIREALSILESALELAENEKLIWRIKTYLGLCHKYSDPSHSLSLLELSEEHYRSAGDNVRLVTVLRHIGLVYIHVKNFPSAEKYLSEAITIAVEAGMPQHENEAFNAKGWMWINQKKYDKARDLFDRLIQKDLSPYLMSLALQNIGYLEYERQNYREAIKFHSQSFQLSTRYEMRDMAFEDYYKLGLCHEKLDEIGLADHFYSTGYKEVMKELEMGLPILGYRKKLLAAYVEFLCKNQRIPQVDIRGEIFSFTANKTLKETRNIFHKNLLSLHLEQTKNAPQLCKHLKIDTRTYFLYQKKLDLKRGEVQELPLGDNPHFSHYLESLVPLTWKEANRKFEDDLYAYLLHKYQYNKKKMAEVLDISYQQVVMKTK